MIAEPILRTFRLSELRPSRWQARTTFDPAGLLDLAQSLQQHGQLTPLLVWIDEEGRPELLAGERRTRAMLALAFTESGHFADLERATAWCATHGLDWLHAPTGVGPAGADAAKFEADFQRDLALAPQPLCRVISGTPAELEQAALVDNLQRADLGALDEARALQRMIDAHGHSQRELAALIGKSQTYISQRLMLLDLHPDLVAQHLAGELDLATARELARLGPGAQVAARKYGQEKSLSSRQVKALVAGVLELAEPSAWPADGQRARPNALMAATLAERTADQRQKAIIRYAASRAATLPRAPENDWEYKDALTAVGIADAASRPPDETFVDHAAQIGASCANCQVRPFASRVAMIRAQTAGRSLPVGFPACAEGVTVCAGYIAESATDVQMPVPRDGNELPDELRVHVRESKFWDAFADDIAVGLEIAERVLANDRARRREIVEQSETGFARALAALAEDQPALSAHPYSQPCAQCAFHKRGSANPAEWCQFQAQRPNLAGGSTSWSLAHLWRNARGQVIARCILFRYARIEEALPELPGALTAPASLLAALIRQVSPKDYLSAPIPPAWLNCSRKGANAADAPPAWAEAMAYVGVLAPRLTPGQRLALVVLWPARFSLFPRIGEKATHPDPLNGQPEEWQCVVTYGQNGVQRGEDAPQPPRTLAEVFAAADAPQAEAGTLAAAFTA